VKGRGRILLHTVRIAPLPFAPPALSAVFEKNKQKRKERNVGRETKEKEDKVRKENSVPEALCSAQKTSKQ